MHETEPSLASPPLSNAFLVVSSFLLSIGLLTLSLTLTPLAKVLPAHRSRTSDESQWLYFGLMESRAESGGIGDFPSREAPQEKRHNVRV